MIFHREKTTQLRMGFYTEVGRFCQHNEDSLIWHDPGNDSKILKSRGRVYIVADGMGGYAAGEVASEIAVKTIVQHYTTSTPQEIVPALDSAIQAANQEIYNQAQSGGKGGMGTTVVCMVVRGNELYVGHVGDSRAYLLREGSLTLLTQDHSLVAELVRKGELSEEAAKHDSRRHLISRTLGRRVEVVPEIHGPIPLQTGDRLLLCTDGIHEYLDDQQIAYVLQANQDDPQAAAVALTQFADSVGGDDNATAIVVALDQVVGVK